MEKYKASNWVNQSMDSSCHNTWLNQHCYAIFSCHPTICCNLQLQPTHNRRTMINSLQTVHTCVKFQFLHILIHINYNVIWCATILCIWNCWNGKSSSSHFPLLLSDILPHTMRINSCNQNQIRDSAWALKPFQAKFLAYWN